MSKNLTVEHDGDVNAFLSSVDHPGRRADGLALCELFTRVTGWNPRMWGPSIVGFGRYHYVYESGREGDFLATGFSPRRNALSIYVMPGYAEFGDILDRLGPHRAGASCLYVTRLARIDLDVLEELIRAGLDDLGARWPVEPT